MSFVKDDQPQADNASLQEVQNFPNYNLIGARLDEHDKSVERLTNAVSSIIESNKKFSTLLTGVLIVLGLGFFSLLFTAIIYFSDSTDRFRSELEAIHRPPIAVTVKHDTVFQGIAPTPKHRVRKYSYRRDPEYLPE